MPLNGRSMKALYITRPAENSESIQIDLIDRPIPVIGEGECLIKVIASGINPSDALGAIGHFNHVHFPRIPCRDFSGRVVDGPKHLIGKNVWGGGAGICSDGVGAEFIKLAPAEIAEIPTTLDPLIAGGQPLPYITAYYGLEKRAHIQPNETVLVVGALGQVGRAAMSICHYKKCKAIALVHGEKEVEKAKQLGWNVIDDEDKNLSEKILAANEGRRVNVILNSVGNAYWNELIKSLSEFGRMVLIAGRPRVRETTLNLFDLYRENQDIIGINTLSFGFSENAEMLRELKVGFETGQLLPLPIEPATIYAPEEASEAYRESMRPPSGRRILIKFP